MGVWIREVLLPSLDTIDYVTRIGNNATCAADSGCAALHFLLDDEVTNLGVVFN